MVKSVTLEITNAATRTPAATEPEDFEFLIMVDSAMPNDRKINCTTNMLKIVDKIISDTFSPLL